MLGGASDFFRLIEILCEQCVKNAQKKMYIHIKIYIFFMYKMNGKSFNRIDRLDRDSQMVGWCIRILFYTMVISKQTSKHWEFNFVCYF